MRLSRALGAIGRTLVSVGVLLLLFVAYQLWGTGLQEARAQNDLRSEFARVIATTTTTTGPGSPGQATVPPTTLPPTPQGEAVALLRIPRIGVDKAVVAGVSVADLKKGPGHYPDSPLPGQPGNAAIAGHRTTYGAPFYRLDELAVGDEILVTTLQGDFRFEVDRSSVVKPDQLDVLDPTPEARLTLTTCNPRFSASQRLIVSAVLATEPAPAPPTTVPTVVPDPPPGGSGTTEPPPTIEDEGAGLSGDPAARGPAVLWGSLAALVWLVTWMAARRWRPWPAYMLGLPLFLVVLFVFYENVSRLLPANI